MGRDSGGTRSGEAVVDDELAVVFAGMLDEAVGQVVNARLLVGEGIDEQVGHSFIAFGLDGGGAVGEGFLHKGDDVGFGFVDGAFGVLIHFGFVSADGVGEEIVCAGGVQELFGEAALGGRGFEVVFVLGKIFGHGDEFAANIVPGVEQGLRRAVRGLYGCIFLGVLGMGGESENCQRPAGRRRGMGALRIGFLRENSR